MSHTSSLLTAQGGRADVMLYRNAAGFAPKYVDSNYASTMDAHKDFSSSSGRADVVYTPHGHDYQIDAHEGHSQTLTARMGTGGQNLPFKHHASTARYLTPIECERLMGLPDDHTRIPWRGKPAEECPKGHRYQAIGNAIAVPMLRWVGDGIELMEDALNANPS